MFLFPVSGNTLDSRKFWLKEIGLVPIFWNKQNNSKMPGISSSFSNDENDNNENKMPEGMRDSQKSGSIISSQKVPEDLTISDSCTPKAGSVVESNLHLMSTATKTVPHASLIGVNQWIYLFKILKVLNKSLQFVI